jgi:HlyD family secretion protein
MNGKIIAALAVAGILCLPVIAKLAHGSRPAKTVEIDRIGYRDIKSSILASGHLLYEEQVVLSPEVIGKVSTIFVKEGQQVRKGEVLLHLDDEAYRAEVAQQQAAVRQQRIAIEQQQLNVQNQENQYQRKVELHKMKMIADSQIDEARYALDLAKIELRNSRSRLEQVDAVLKQANERLSKTTIRAPISGTITALDIKVGETAVASQISIAGSTLMTVANTSTMVTEVNVDEADIAKIAVDQEVAIHTAAYPDVALKGKVLTIPLSPKQDPAGTTPGASRARTFDVRVQLADVGKLALRPGMSCRAEIFVASTGKSLALPLQAVLSSNDESDGTKQAREQSAAPVKAQTYVFVAKDGKAQRRFVTVGISDDSSQEILSGLADGETVITGPYKTLRQLQPGDRVSGDEKPVAAAKPAHSPAPATARTST